MKSILDKADLNRLKGIIFDAQEQRDLDLMEAEIHKMYFEQEEQEGQEQTLVDDPYEAIMAYVTPEYADEYDIVGAINDISTNDGCGNLILKEGMRTEQGHLSDRFADIIDCHHIELESYWLTTLSGLTLYVGESQKECVDAFISYMDEVHDTDSCVIDFDEMVDMLDELGLPLHLEVTRYPVCAPPVVHFHGNPLFENLGSLGRHNHV